MLLYILSQLLFSLQAGSLVRVRGKCLAEELPSHKESSAHFTRGMAVPPPKTFPELAEVSPLAG